VKADELATTVSNVDLVNYILSNFKTVDEVRDAMPKIPAASTSNGAHELNLVNNTTTSIGTRKIRATVRELGRFTGRSQTS
jgi:hypothetical protein